MADPGKCSTCNGAAKCLNCGGLGVVFTRDKGNQRCPVCNGSGKCTGCGGSGRG